MVGSSDLKPLRIGCSSSAAASRSMVLLAVAGDWSRSASRQPGAASLPRRCHPTSSRPNPETRSREFPSVSILRKSMH